MRSQSHQNASLIQERYHPQQEDAVSLLTNQHREVEQLFSELETEGIRNKTKKQLFETLDEKLTLHTKLEEKYMYPQLKEMDEESAIEAYEEHGVVKMLLKKLRNTDPDDEAFGARIKFLKELVEHHVEEEEDELFPKWKRFAEEDAIFDAGMKMQQLVEKEQPKSRKTKRLH